jgi:hypothetical protein
VNWRPACGRLRPDRTVRLWWSGRHAADFSDEWWSGGLWREGMAELEQGGTESPLMVGWDGCMPLANRLAQPSEVRSWVMSVARARSAHSITWACPRSVCYRPGRLHRLVNHKGEPVAARLVATDPDRISACDPTVHDHGYRVSHARTAWLIREQYTVRPRSPPTPPSTPGELGEA